MSGETHFDFTANRNGHDSPAPGNLAFNQIDLRRIDKRQKEVEEKKDGTLVATVREKISNDGNELTATTTTAGHADKITVWTRSGGQKVANDPLSANGRRISARPVCGKGWCSKSRRTEAAGSIFWVTSATPLALTESNMI